MPDVVGKRNHFETVQTVLEDWFWRRVPPAIRTPELRDVLLKFGEMLVRHLSDAYSVAAQRGIEQAARLVVDADYYDTVKERRRRQAVRQAEYDEQQRLERLERQTCPTAEQIEDERHRLTTYIADYKRQIESWEVRLKSLPKDSKHVRLGPGGTKPK